ncbi:gliding motility-associated C-terminal domain-containing protein [Arcticibacter tournemirensis]|uniref:T9SS type B sorting domain-containing protein n=1 Tax=Arcticibacter tournemirensis TaxID=699437 RepID=A0A4Q0M4H7_9SPHI|nr:gliding motility-associated C-terminal domain-containing protein [Arcticibacter tournemirensis]RXF67860.1 T9SS type B sorting domain-containing protein [Arcticibacter tournemirensis]
MKKLIVFMVCLMAVSLNKDAIAQLKADGQGIYIKSGTPFSSDGLSLIPSVDFELKNLTLLRGNSAVSWPQYNSITRIYHFSSPVLFRGTMALDFLNTELNGNNASSLNLAYTSIIGSNNYKDYLLASGSISNTYDRYVSQLFSDAVNVSDVTAVSSGFVIPPVIASGSTTFCKGSSVTLSTVLASSWQWYRNGVQLQGATQRELTVTDNGDYSVQAVLANGISTISDPVTVKVVQAPNGKILADKGENLSLGDEVVLTSNGGTSYLWDVSEGLIGGQSTDSSIVVRPLKTTTYKVIVNNGAGCSVTQSIVINVVNDYKTLVANNMVTPNSDGVNDVWIVKNIDLYPNNEVKIFDRAGRVVFSQNGYNNTWDATFNGVPVPEDTFYYVLSIDSGKNKMTGFISVVKE